MEGKSDDSIQVCVRVRPGQEDHSILEFNDTEIHLDKNHFGFDRIFSPSCSQDDIFHAVGTKIIAHTLDGYNGCVFVYGQTGSGKTYTMMGDNNGLMQKSFVRLFEEIQGLSETECILSCSYYEIYNQQIIDLLDVKKDKEKKMVIRQDLKKGVYIDNMTEEPIFNSQKLLDCLSIGMRNRHVGETMMNRESSRSHSIFTISFSMKCSANGVPSLKTPKLHFVDLAGSERQKMTAASGDRLKEAGNINKSLTTLGMVINALACEKTRSHIPYRDSKLTSILRDSLGGNSKTFLIATVSRNALCFQETLSTLNFANRAKMVKVKALINEESLSTNIECYKEEIRRLKSEILRLKSEKKAPVPGQIQHIQPRVENYDTHFKQINEKISVISNQLASNPVSPSFEVLMQQIQNIQPRTERRGDMEDEAEQENVMEEAEDDALIQYLSCNNSLLEKIHMKVEEYMELKQELRNIAYQNTMNIAELKTPSKFERDQYEQKLQKKEQEIETLQREIRSLRERLYEEELKVEQLKIQSSHSSGKIEERNGEIEASFREKAELCREVASLRNLLRQTNEESEKANKKYLEAQAQSKENKQLYLYVEQNYETEKQMRRQIEENLMGKIDELERSTASFTRKLEDQKERAEQIEERLRDEINVLTQTVDFNESLIASFTKQLESQKTSNANLNEKITILEQQLEDDKKCIASLQQYCGLLQRQKEELSAYSSQKYEEYERQIEEWKSTYNCLNQKYEAYYSESQERVKNLECHIEQLKLESEKLSSLLAEAHSQFDKRQAQFNSSVNQLAHSHDEKVFNLIQSHAEEAQKLKDMLCEKQNEISRLANVEKSLQQAGLNQQTEIQSLKEQAVALSSDFASRLESMKAEYGSKMENVNKLEIENEELKRAHKDLLRENYKLKAKYGSNTNKTEDELISKVNYYEEKFKLMSIEYQKALEAVRKMKAKEINQAQKISSLEENQKAMKINSKTTDDKDIASQLQRENSELKKQLDSLKVQKSYALKSLNERDSCEFKMKEQELFSKVQNLIKKLDPSKENISDTKNLEQLLNKWEELDAESEKRIDAIEKGIKKEQKIKTQNKLIMKENIYLKEQLAQMEQELAGQGARPRKILKRASSEVAIDMQ